MNYRFKLDDWLPRFPLLERRGTYSAEIITSPWDLCQNEHLRRELHKAYDWGPAVPTDIFIMADGEPPDRHVTKIGGLPYRPASARWPTRPDGAPLVFLAQFNFSDSRDLTGKLPGDILLVFGDKDFTFENLHFEWQRMGARKLIASDAEPVRESAFAPCYGHICRTANYPEATAYDNSTRYPICRGREVRAPWRMLQYQATQIGAEPFFIQQGDAEQVQGRLLATLSSVQPAANVEFPWVNRQETLEPRQVHHPERLMIGDVGCIYISIDDDDETVHGHWSCY